MNEKLNDDVNENTDSGPECESSSSGDPEELDIDKEHFDEVVREKEQFRAIAQRAQADLVNYRNRATQELEEARRTVKFALLTRFLAIADDLSRAVDSVPDDADQNWSEGILLVLRNLENIFEMEGIKKIDALGAQFDPYLHEALLYEENEDANEGEIITVIQEGYSINDRILRPARVVVAQALNSEEISTDELKTDQINEQEEE